MKYLISVKNKNKMFIVLKVYSRQTIVGCMKQRKYVTYLRIFYK